MEWYSWQYWSHWWSTFGRAGVVTVLLVARALALVQLSHSCQHILIIRIVFAELLVFLLSLHHGFHGFCCDKIKLEKVSIIYFIVIKVLIVAG